MAKSILIIDDELNIRILIAETIKQEFSEMIDKGELLLFDAKDGKQALQVVKKEKPDLVFLDLMIPKIDGFHVCSAIKEDPETNKAYVIMVTGLQEVIKGVMAGADEYMTKPFEVENIIAAVKKIL